MTKPTTQSAELTQAQAQAKAELQDFIAGGINSISEAEEHLLKFNVLEVEAILQRGAEPVEVRVFKLSRASLAEGLQRFATVIMPFIDPDAPTPQLTPELMSQLLTDVPELGDFLIEHSTELNTDLLDDLPWDSWLLLAMAAIQLNFTGNAAVRCFFPVAQGAARSVSAELASEPTPAPSAAVAT